MLLTSAEGLDRAAEVVRRHAEPGAEVRTSPTELAVRFRTARDETALAGMLADLVSGGLAVAQFRELQTDLEEAFMTAARAGDDELPTAEEEDDE